MIHAFVPPWDGRSRDPLDHVVRFGHKQGASFRDLLDRGEYDYLRWVVKHSVIASQPEKDAIRAALEDVGEWDG